MATSMKNAKMMHLSIDKIEGKLETDRALKSGVVERSRLARSKKLCDLDPEDLRTLITQKFGLEYVLPITLDLLEREPLVSSGLFRGDLLLSVLNLGPDFFSEHSEWIEKLMEIKFELEEVQQTLTEDIQPLIKDITY